MMPMKLSLARRSAYPWQVPKARASILILSLWSLCLLSVFAVILNYNVRQKISLVRRLESRDKLSLVAQAGVKKAIVFLKKIEAEESKTTFALKDSWSSNADVFKDVVLGDAVFNVSYNLGEVEGFRSGLMDEERKININLADMEVMRRLFQVTCGMNAMEAQDLASVIVDWRDSDSALSSASGGAEDPYYRNTSFPYEAKDAAFEVLDELLLVKGMNEEIFEKVKDFVTVYGEGRVNINTAAASVLMALGLNPGTTDKIISFRNGKDEVEATADDNIFSSPSQILPFLSGAVALTPAEIAVIAHLSGNSFTTESNYFMIISRGTFPNKKERAEVTSIIDRKGKVLSWKQS
jgi:general secretion pathway protein K